MRILKFKSQLTIAFFAAFNHLNGPLRKQNFILTGSKGHGLWFLIGGFRSVLWVSVFQGSLLVIVIMIDASKKRNCERGFWTLEFACLWKAQQGGIEWNLFLVFALLKIKIAEAISIHCCAYMRDHFTNILHLKEFSSFMQQYQDHTIQYKIV